VGLRTYQHPGKREFEDVHILIILSHIHLLKYCGPNCYLDTVLTVDIPAIIIFHNIHKYKQNDSLPLNSTEHIAFEYQRL